MGLFDSIKSMASSAFSSLQSEVSKIKNNSFMEATVNAAILVAYADRNISDSEKQKLMNLIKTSTLLKHYDSNDVMKEYNEVMTKFNFEYFVGVGEALAKIAKFRGKPEAQLLVQSCLAIANSDGVFSKEEKDMVTRIIQTLGLEPSHFSI